MILGAQVGAVEKGQSGIHLRCTEKKGAIEQVSEIGLADIQLIRLRISHGCIKSVAGDLTQVWSGSKGWGAERYFRC